jgi:amino acid adenylation domain-containing protein
VILAEVDGVTRPSVLQEIINRAVADPDHPAALDLERALTYAQLIDEVARVGAGLSARGITEGDRVALLIPNSVDFIVAALASQWIGATFVPLAITDPLPRLTTVVDDLIPKLIITSLRGDHEFPNSFDDVATVPLDDLVAERGAPDHSSDSSRVAYIIYTSGTTGKPKGVQISVAAFANAVRSTADALGLDRTTRTLCVSPFHFDGSYANLFPTLISGGTIIMRPREALLYPRTFFNTITNEKITYSGFTPSYLRLLLASPQFSILQDSTLKVIALGGEAIAVADLRTLWSKTPAIRVFNRYGPTETTISVTNVELTPDMIEHGTVTIGRPHPGITFVLVDDERDIIDTSHRTGELYIGGVQLMDGYWADSDLTESVMRRDVVLGHTLYRTGDLVYRDDDGSYVYVDRADRVVKRSGVRISLIELSSTMSQLEHVTAAACLTFDQEGDLGIVAFVVVDTELPVDIRRASITVLPANMLPDRIELVAEMPLNSSNTLDESGLLATAGLRPFTRRLVTD